MTQTLGQTNLEVPFQDYVLHLGRATTDVQVLVLMLLRQTGALGNTVFFVCSAWFLVGKKGNARKKAFRLLVTVWCVSILILSVYLMICPTYLTAKTLIEQLLPTTFGNNWYMTCYIIFLFIYPWLNKMIALTDQKQLLRIVLFSSLLWIVADYFKGDLFFPSVLIVWVVIYFLVAYLKLYCGRIMASRNFGIMLLATGILGYIAQVVVTNYVGLYLIGAFSDKVLRWNSHSCPFYIMIAIGSLIIALQVKYKNKVINYISGLTIFAYLFHENYLFRRFTRPAIWQYLYMNYGYSHVLILDITFSVVLFFATLVVSCIYKETIQKIVMKFSDRVYPFVTELYGRVEKFLLNNK